MCIRDRFILLLLRGKPEARRSRYLIGVCFFNLALFAGYKLSLSMDATYIRAYYPNGFNIFNELPLHLCNINLFLIPLGVWKRNRSIMGFSFLHRPAGKSTLVQRLHLAFLHQKDDVVLRLSQCVDQFIAERGEMCIRDRVCMLPSAGMPIALSRAF